MTTTVTVHVNGEYRTTVKKNGVVVATIDGDGPEETKWKSFGAHHPADAVFEISEEPLTAEMKAAR